MTKNNKSATGKAPRKKYNFSKVNKGTEKTNCHRPKKIGKWDKLEAACHKCRKYVTSCMNACN